MYQVTIHFDDGRTPIELLAEASDIELEGNPQDGGLQKCTYTARGGHRAPGKQGMERRPCAAMLGDRSRARKVGAARRGPGRGVAGRGVVGVAVAVPRAA